MIIKLAEFESGITKEAGLYDALKKYVGKGINKAELTEIADELAQKGSKLKNYGVGRATAAGNASEKALNSILGVDATGYAGDKVNNLIEHIRRNKAAYGGAAILGGGGAYAYNRMKKK